MEERARKIVADYDAQAHRAPSLRGAEERARLRAEGAAHERQVLGAARDEAQKALDERARQDQPPTPTRRAPSSRPRPTRWPSRWPRRSSAGRSRDEAPARARLPSLACCSPRRSSRRQPASRRSSEGRSRPKAAPTAPAPTSTSPRPRGIVNWWSWDYGPNAKDPAHKRLAAAVRLRAHQLRHLPRASCTRWRGKPLQAVHARPPRRDRKDLDEAARAARRGRGEAQASTRRKVAGLDARDRRAARRRSARRPRRRRRASSPPPRQQAERAQGRRRARRSQAEIERARARAAPRRWSRPPSAPPSRLAQEADRRRRSAQAWPSATSPTSRQQRARPGGAS